MVERITYQNPENGYTVARLAPERAEAADDGGRPPGHPRRHAGGSAPRRGDRRAGWWHNDPKHGWQFQVLDYRTTLPATIQGMRRYLGSGLVKGIGPVMAGRIVDAFGDETFAVIDEARAADRGAGHRPGAGGSHRRDLD